MNLRSLHGQRQGSGHGHRGRFRVGLRLRVRLALRLAFVILVGITSIVVQASCARSVSSDFSESPPSFGFGSDSGVRPGENQCVETACPAPWATCPGARGPCTTDTTRDVRHCGACDAPCRRPARSEHATALCASGKCEIACEALYADCNGSSSDGCEISTADDPKNCGACGNACEGGVLCWRGACGCPNGFTQCGDDCKKLDSDSANCGSCGNVCQAPKSDTDPAWSCGPGVTPPQTQWTCAAASCQLLCKSGFGDCNRLFCGDGCEVDLRSDADNCGACGNRCEAGQACVQGACICPPGTTRCGDACVDLQLDPTNCGACRNRCPGPSATRPGVVVGGGPACNRGECSYVCFPGYADCDQDVDNGCEVNLASSQRHCGSCNTSCSVAAGQPCVGGRCLTRECEAGVLF